MRSACCSIAMAISRHATTTSPACRGPAGQIWTGGKHPSGEASSDRRTPKPAARRAVTPAHARAFAINFLRAHCSRWLDHQCQTTRGSIRVLRVARILSVVVPHLQLPALFEKARERGHADKDARSVAGRPSLWKRVRRAVSNESTLHLKMHGPGKTPC